MMIAVTESAQAYLRELLDKQNGEILGMRVFFNSLGTPKAETCIAYCRQEDVQGANDRLELLHLVAYIDERSIPFLDDAVVDYSKDRMGGQFTIKAPNSKTPYVDESSPLEGRINYTLMAMTHCETDTFPRTADVLGFCTPRPFKFQSTGDLISWRQGPDNKWHLTLFIENGSIKDLTGHTPRSAVCKSRSPPACAATAWRVSLFLPVVWLLPNPSATSLISLRISIKNSTRLAFATLILSSV
jgi:Fe-S cluster assembly iron-binding protein IscA